jgi:alpha-amylase/alpha-mannosidase (GH57 family)
VAKTDYSNLCVLGHFSQPQRGNPLTGEIGIELDAAPYANWNERITDSSIRPNAEAGNFAHVSYSFNPTLLNWLKQNAPSTYQTLVENDQSGGRALATAYHHAILPLARKRDKRTQIRWGIAAFEHHFGRKPLGFWLPEMAVDTETLTLLAESGIQYTVLSRKQISDFPNDGAGPYRVMLPQEQSIGVFVRDDGLSGEISFNIHNLGGAGRWSHLVLAPARRFVGPLLLLATAGETFGHHYAGEEQFLRWLVSHEAKAAGYEMTSLDEYFVKHSPQHSVQAIERSSWSDHPGLAHWATGAADGNTMWKGGLRRALDNAASELDRNYEEALRPHGLDPWDIRDQYASVLLGEMSADSFLDKHAPSVERESLKALLSAQELAQRMYSSYTFTDPNLESRQPRYAIACAAAALAIAQQATKHELAERLPLDLAVVTSSSVSGDAILREVVAEFGLNLAAVK